MDFRGWPVWYAYARVVPENRHDRIHIFLSLSVIIVRPFLIDECSWHTGHWFRMFFQDCGRSNIVLYRDFTLCDDRRYPLTFGSCTEIRHAVSNVSVECGACLRSEGEHLRHHATKNLISVAHWTKSHWPRLTENGIAASATLPAVTRNGLSEVVKRIVG